MPDYWGPGKKLLSDSKALLEKIEQFDRDNIKEEILVALKKDFTADSLFDPATVAKTSSVGEALCRWVKLIDQFTNIDAANQDKKDLLKAAKEDFENFKITFKEKKKKVDDQEDLLTGLKQQQVENKEKRKEIKDETDFGKLKKSRGINIVETFAKEKLWWQKEKEKEECYLDCLLGDILLMSAMLLYLPSFPNHARDKTLQKFSEILAEKEVRFSDNNARISLFLSEKVIKQWDHFGLPLHNFYIINGLLMTTCPRWPLLVDPEQQATNWIKNLEEDLVLLDANEPELIRKIQNCVELGSATMVCNVEDQIDSHLDNLIKKKLFVEDGTQYVMIADTKVKFDAKFKLFFTSKKDRVDFPSRVQSHLTIINFVPVSAGLNDHLLRIVVAKGLFRNINQKDKYRVEGKVLVNNISLCTI